MKSIAKQLGEKLGGAWQYAGTTWRCDDGHRYVSRVHTGGFDVNGEALPGFGYFLFGGDLSQRIYLNDSLRRQFSGEGSNG